jgi:hypothetical protein
VLKVTDRIRVRRIEEPILPDYIPETALGEYFDFVDAQYDVTFLPWIHYEAEQERLEDDYWTRYIVPGSLLAIVYGLDDYHLPTHLNRRATRVVEQCDMVIGSQLPVDLDRSGLTPICYPMVSHQEAQASDAEIIGETDVFFWGDYIAGPKAVPPYPKEGERYRSDVLSAIETLGHGRWRTDFRDVRFWYQEKEERSKYTNAFRAAMLNSKLCLSLYGRGYNTIRNSDTFGLRRALLGPDVSQHVLVPDANLWRSQEIGFIFKDDLSDLESVIDYALSDTAERKRRAENGWNYYQRHCTPAAILRTIYKAVRRAVDRRAF